MILILTGDFLLPHGRSKKDFLMRIENNESNELVRLIN